MASALLLTQLCSSVLLAECPNGIGRCTAGRQEAAIVGHLDAPHRHAVYRTRPSTMRGAPYVAAADTLDTFVRVLLIDADIGACCAAGELPAIGKITHALVRAGDSKLFLHLLCVLRRRLLYARGEGNSQGINSNRGGFHGLQLTTSSSFNTKFCS